MTEIQSPASRLDAYVETLKSDLPAFKALGQGSYRLHLPKLQATLEVDYLRRDAGQLKGEILVRCELPGARTMDGVLTVADVNLSSTRTRAAFAKDLDVMARTKNSEGDWREAIESFAMRILATERQGEPAVWLSEVALPERESLLYIDGFPLLRCHPLILFGEGGTAKSMLALYFAGRLAEKGHRVGLFDWELDASEHRLRLGRLFPVGSLPKIRYVRCSQPFCREAERLRKMVKADALDFVVFDSVGYACDGPPEEAEQAMRYFQALRTLGPVGSLHIAHVRGGEGGDQRPFGSMFWANSARSTWNIKPASREADDNRVQVALHHRKFNTTGRMRSIGFEVTFGEDETAVRSIELGRVPDLAAQLALGERVRLVLGRGPLTREELRAELEDVKDDTLRKVLNREKKAGKVLEFPEGRFALKENLFGGA